MSVRLFRPTIAAVCCLVGWVTAAGPVAAASPPLDAGTTRMLVGTSGGSIDSYAFTVPGTTTAPTVSVAFTPSDFANGTHAGFTVLLNGTQVGVGGQTATAGTLQDTLPQNPAGPAVVQVFAFDAATPVGFTIKVAGLPAGPPGGPAGTLGSPTAPAPLSGQASGTLSANSGGSYAYFTFPSAGASPPTTVSLTYAPANATVAQAVGFNVVDRYANTIAGAVQPKDQYQPAATLTVDLSRPPGEPLTIFVYNYAPGVLVTYRLSVSGIAPLSPAAAPPAAAPAAGVVSSAPSTGFQPFWVENFRPTPLWSGPDAQAVSFGLQPQFSSFQVVRPQSGSRLYVYNPRTHNYGYLDAADAGPSGPPGGV